MDYQTPTLELDRRPSCLSPLIGALTILSLLAALLIAGCFAFWSWTMTLSRTNILILGLDRRPEQGYVVRSDTIILMTVYPQGSRVALLSIPRDLYVPIPGYGDNRINTAHFWGESGASGGGPPLAVQTVEANFGVRVDRYVRMDFDGFRAIIDAVGGVDIIVDEPVVDHSYPTEDYGIIGIEISAGPQRMDGETALRYARSRHGSSDFERARRQQQVIVAFGRRLLTPKVWPSLPILLQIAQQHLDTDLTAWDALVLAPTLYQVGPEGIERYIIGRDMTTPWTTPTGGAVLMPRWDLIRPLVISLFTP